VNTTSVKELLARALRFALVIALFAAGWSIYRRLPDDASSVFGGTPQARETKLRIVIQRTVNDSVLKNEIPIRLYSINVAAAQREFLADRRAGMRLEDFIERRMKGRPVIEGQLDERGEVTLSVPHGTWWIHATRNDAEEITWRYRVNISGREQTVELTPDNAYTRAKRF
jgi:hypothetical protein